MRDGLFWLIYTDVKRYGRTTVGGASGASLRDFHNYLVTCSAHRRRVVGSGVSQQQRLRSVAVPRRRRPQVSASTSSGTIGPGSNRFAGIVLQEYSRAQRKLIGERKNIFQGTPTRPHRSAAPLQAQRLVLPDHRRRRHGLGTRRDDGALAIAHRPLRAASRHVHHRARGNRPDAELQRAGHARSGRDAGRARPTWCICAAGRCAIVAVACSAARPRIQRMIWGDDGWLRTTDGQGVPAARDAGARLCPPHPFPPRRCGRISTATAADRLPVVALAVAGRVVQPHRAARLSASVWPRDDRQPVPAGARRPPPAGALLQRDDRRWSSSRSTSSSRPGLVCYYNRAKFHYLYVSHDEAVGQAPARDDRAAGLPAGRCFTAPIPLPGGAGPSARGGRLRAACLRLPGRVRRRTGSGCRSSSTPASCPTRPPRPARRTSPAPSSAWLVRTCGRRAPADFDYFEYREREYRVGPFTPSGVRG